MSLSRKHGLRLCGVPFLVLIAVSGCNCQDRVRLLRVEDDPQESPSLGTISWDGGSRPLPTAVIGGATDVPLDNPIVGCVDKDGDGYGEGTTCLGPDCDDSDPALGQDGQRSCYSGANGTQGVGVCRSGTQSCTNGALTPCENEVVPTAETCDGQDNDCDGVVDEEISRSCYTGPSGTEGVGVCAAGTQTCSAGVFGDCVGEVLPGPEVCDALDNDCNGAVDEGVQRTCYDGPAGTQGVGSCTGGVQVCNAGVFGSCVGEVLPAAELCDSVDNDCDGLVDELLTRSCYDGPPGTEGVGVCLHGAQICAGGVYGACLGERLPSAEICDALDNDCNGAVDEQLTRSCYDGPAGTANVGVCKGGTQTCTAGAYGSCAGEVTPSAEICDNADNDCNGQVDEQLVRSCYDGPAGTQNVGVCKGGSQTCVAGAYGSCSGEVTPSAETCDDADNDCDGQVDEQLTRACYDGPSGTENVGVCKGGTQTCVAGAYGSCAGEVTPSAETCDNADNDCNGQVDEQLTRACYDGPSGTENIGLCKGGTQTCVAGAYGNCAGEVTPAAETCDNADNDCDGQVDEELTRSCYDGPRGTENVGACKSGTQSCVAGAYGSCSGEVTPSSETCDNADNDCNGEVDERLTRSCYDGPLGTQNVGVCKGGIQTCAAGAYGNCAGEVTPSAESCDNADNDCDGQIDQGLTRTCYDGPAGTAGVGICISGTQLCSAGAWGTCGGESVPATETCDGLDDNCNGQTDENIARVSRDGTSQNVNVTMKPIDIIMVIDNSCSMTDEIVAVQNNINGSFASIIAQSGLDYRVIMLSAHGSAAQTQSICVSSPLSENGNCTGTLAACPKNGSRFFQYSVEIGSHNSFSQILSTYNSRDACNLAPNGWSQWLRANAEKVFLEITDDGPTGPTSKPDGMTAAIFEPKLFALTPSMFGTATNLNFVWHTIAGLHENNPRLLPWQPADPLVTTLCTGNGGQVVQNGAEYQKLSQQSGGLRFPICEYQSFDAVFQAIAKGIVAGAQMACDFQVTQVPPGSSMNDAALEYVPSNGGATLPLTRVADSSSCSGNGYYVSGSTITLCPASCSMWQSDKAARVDVLFSCSPRSP